MKNKSFIEFYRKWIQEHQDIQSKLYSEALSFFDIKEDSEAAGFLWDYFYNADSNSWREYCLKQLKKLGVKVR